MANAPDDAEQQDHRQQRLARRAQHLLRALDRGDAERNHQQVGEDEDDEDGVERHRVVHEDGRPGGEALDVEHADDDGRDRVARDAEDQRRNPRPGERAVVGRARLDDALDVGQCRTFPAPWRTFSTWRRTSTQRLSAPAPGRAPIAVPSTLPRRVCQGYFFISPHIPLNTLPILACAICQGGVDWRLRRAESPTPRTCRS